MNVINHYNNNFFQQKMEIKRINVDRRSFLLELTDNKTVLHVGCSDYPLFNPKYNLHVFLSNVSTIRRIDGVDINGLEELKKYCPNSLFYDNIDDVKDNYDLILIPDVIEHVDNIEFFLKSVCKLKFKEAFITVPNVAGHYEKGFLKSDQNYIEEVHPDHKVWFSPYTIYNCIKSFTNWDIIEIGCIEDNCTVYLIAKNKL